MYILVELERYSNFSEIFAYESAKTHFLFIHTFLFILGTSYQEH